MNPRVSVIMGVYRPESFDELKKAIHSILEQSMTELEFLIYLDGENKEAEKIIHEFMDVDGRIRLLGNKENRGLAYSLNECVRFTKGEYIARMDADDISQKNRLKMP